MNNEKDQFLETAYRIGIKLSRDSIWSDKKCNWVGPSMEYIDNAWKTAQKVCGTDLYNGTCGIGYFLSYLYSYTGDEIIKNTALGSFRQAISNKEQIHLNARIGFYTGWAGMIRALQNCSPLLHTDEFEKEISFMLKSLNECNLEESGIDVLAGIAGAIPVLICQNNVYRERSIETAEKIADHLIKIANRSQKGWSWNTLGTLANTKNLTGFSHGTAGIAWAFIELYNLTKKDKYLTAAQNAFQYERVLFNPQYNNWPDLRNENGNANGTSYTSLAWCHGAPGIGLSRIRCYDLINDEYCKREAEVAINTTYNMINQSLQSGQFNFSLCHGIAGNTELLVVASSSLKSEDLMKYGKYIGFAGIDAYNRNSQWSCGIAGAGEVPGLMLGLAGIGYFYLRLFDLGRTPSILLPAVDEAQLQ